LPVPAANINKIAAFKNVIYYATAPVPVLGGDIPGQVPELRAYNLKKRKALTRPKASATALLCLPMAQPCSMNKRANGWCCPPPSSRTRNPNR
jgi:hypothetical protein